MSAGPSAEVSERLGFERWPELLRLDQGREGTPADRRRALVKAAQAVRERFVASGIVEGLASHELVRFPYPSRYGLRDALSSPVPFLCLTNRVFVVKYLDFQDVRRVLVVSPSDVTANGETPFFKGLIEQFGRLRGLAETVISRRGKTVAEALSASGVRPDEVDFITYDHLHTQDLRGWLGTAGRPAFFPRAKLLVMREEWATVSGLSEPQRPWYCPGGADGVDAARVVLLDDSVALGRGVMLVRTPGHTEGNHSVVIGSGLGVTVTSENGVCADSYEPSASRIAGLAAYARSTGMDVVLNGNTLERGLDQYLSMIVEKTLAGPSPRDGRLPNFLASSELTPAWYAPGIKAGLAFGDVAFGNPSLASLASPAAAFATKGTRI